MTHRKDWSDLAAAGVGPIHLTVAGGQNLSAAGNQVIGLKFVAEQTNLALAVGHGLNARDEGSGHGLTAHDGGSGLVV